MNENEKGLINPTSLIKDKEIEIGDSYSQILSAVAFPSQLQMGWLKNPLTLPSDFVIATHIERISEGQVFKTIERKRVNLQSYKMEEIQHRKVPSYKVDRAMDSIEAFSRDVASSNESVFKIGIRTAVFGKSPKEVQSASEGISAKFGSVILNTLRFRQKQGLTSTAFLGKDDLPKNQLLSVRGVAGSLPIFVKEFQMDDGIVYGINPETHSIIKLNEWKFPNSHIVILGPSGFGKTFFAKLVVTRSALFRDERIFIIDQQGEYELLTSFLKGTYIDRTDKYRINPFARKEDIRKSVNFAKNFILLLLERVTQEEGAMIEKALFSMYEKYEKPIFSNFIEEIKTESIALRLTPYYSGIYAPYFNGETNVDLSNKFVAFNYSRSPGEIKKLLVYIDFAYIIENAFDQREKTKLLIDEGWTLLLSTIGQDLVRDVFKTGRKFNLSVVFATHHIADVVKTDAGIAALEQPVIKFLTTQNEASLPVVKQTFILNNEQERILQASGIGRGILIVGNEKIPLEVVGTELEEKLFDTRPEQMRKNIEDFKNGRF